MALAILAPASAGASTGGVSPSAAPPPSVAHTVAHTGGALSGRLPARISRDALAAAARSLGRHPLRRGARGRDVRTLQLVLTALGYRVRPSGSFDAATLRQVRRFQRAWRLPVVGFVGPATGRALRNALAGGRPPGPAAPNLAPAPPVPVPAGRDGWTFPVRGPHSYGDAADRYGAARSGHTHAGQDVLASCGTPLVAAHAGSVIGAGPGGQAGYYVAVHATGTPYDYFYAHLRNPPLVSAGSGVRTGQLVGYVGATGDAVGCHLHLELWSGAWWGGGHTVDPLPFLRVWDG